MSDNWRQIENVGVTNLVEMRECHAQCVTVGRFAKVSIVRLNLFLNFVTAPATMVGWMCNAKLKEYHERTFTESKIAMIW